MSKSKNYEEGRIARRQGCLDFIPYNLKTNPSEWSEWKKGYEEGQGPESDSILQKLWKEGVLSLFRQGNGVLAVSHYDEGPEMNLTKEDLIELKHHLETWIIELS